MKSDLSTNEYSDLNVMIYGWLESKGYEMGDLQYELIEEVTSDMMDRLLDL